MAPPAFAASTPAPVLALAAAAALWLALVVLQWAARAAPRALEALAPVPALEFELEDGEEGDVGRRGVVEGRPGPRIGRAPALESRPRPGRRWRAPIRPHTCPHLPSFAAEANDEIDAPLYKEPVRAPKAAKTPATIPCYDPATMQSLGIVPAMTPGQVVDAISRCRAAARVWALSPFSQRRALMRVLLKHVVDNQETLCR